MVKFHLREAVLLPLSVGLHGFDCSSTFSADKHGRVC